MRVLVAGATGVIGRALVPKLVQAGHEVAGTSRSGDRMDEVRGMGAEAVMCDALDPDSLRTALADVAPEAVIHELTNLPARLDPRKYKTQLAATNLLRREGTRNLVDAAGAAGVRKILAQSIAFAYEPSGDWIKGEDAPLALGAPPPMTDAVGAVAELERRVLDPAPGAEGRVGIVLRYGFFYGAGTTFAPDGYTAELVRKRRFPVVGSGEGRFSFVHIDDAATATVAALERGHPGIYNVCDDDPAAVSEWLPVYAEALGAKPPMRLPAWLVRILAGGVAASGMTTQRGASNEKAKRELGWSPSYPSWRDGFRDALGP
jgi:nucleoside-diphosphate-sugar epimerase